MNLEEYKKISEELETITDRPVPAHPTEAEFNRVEQIRDELKAARHEEIGITKDELDGAIGMAQDRLLDLIHAKH